MSADLELLLRDLLAAPARLSMLSPEEERALVASLRALAGGEQPPSAAVVPAAATPVLPPTWTGDDLLTVAEAAAMLRVSPRWLYRHAKTLPFARKLSRKVLRFSRSGLTRWLANKRL